MDNKIFFGQQLKTNLKLTAMKRFFLTTAFILAAGMATFAAKIVAEGKTYSTLGDYRIETSDQRVTINGKEMDAFVIRYDNTDATVTVAIEKGNRCKKYYVLSDNLSVQYVCNKDYFGVEKLDRTIMNEGFNTNQETLNHREYFHQKVLSDGGLSDLENSKMIAAFYPMLLNNVSPVLE